MKKLNIGCGTDTKEGYINLDMVKKEGVDVVHNLNKYPYPFEDNTFDEVIASHILEHLDNTIKAIEEIWRICRNNAKVYISTPNYNSFHFFSNPQHKSFFNYETFDFLSQNKGKEAKEGLNYYTKAKFDVIGKHITGFKLVPTDKLKVKLNKYVPNLITDLHFVLKMIKMNPKTAEAKRIKDLEKEIDEIIVSRIKTMRTAKDGWALPERAYIEAELQDIRKKIKQKLKRSENANK